MKRTIREAIIQVLKAQNEPMVPEDIYLKIEKNKLYHFNTNQPIHVVKTRLRRDCEGLEFKASNKVKYFQLLSNGSYWLKGISIPRGTQGKVLKTHSELNEKFEKSYQTYTRQFKFDLLNSLKGLTPQEFEAFCMNFIAAYGFRDVKVTPLTRDGGVDGFGNLKIGFTDLNVAFECKRWKKNKIDYKVIRSFRGSLPESCVYGIFFTTSNFTESAKKEAEKKGYKPIVLLDGEDIVEFMIDKKFGVGLETELPVFVNQVDLVLFDNDN